MKIQSRKVFANREAFENLLGKSEDLLMKVGQFEIYYFQLEIIEASDPN